MSLIAMAVYDPPGQSRHGLLFDCLRSLANTVDWKRHRIFIVNNGVSDESKLALGTCFHPPFERIESGSNLGTARAINKAWQLRQPGEHCVKIDSDIVMHDAGWLDKFEEAIGRDPKIGILCGKRRDLLESPNNPPGWTHSDLIMLPHEPGQRWHVVEKSPHCMGSVQLYNSALLDKIGYLYQMGAVYAFDDVLAAVRCEVAGFYSAFYCNVDLEHPDPGGTPYQAWKESITREYWKKYESLAADYRSGKRSVYHGPDDE